MSDFWINFTLGLKHMLQLVAHNDILFLLVLMIPFEKKAWKKIVILISLFISCHTFSLLLTVFNILTLKIKYLRLLKNDLEDYENVGYRHDP